MADRQPIAFLSYVRSDDDHDDGRITSFRKRLEGEVRMQTGKPFAVFQDRNDIAWGQHWEERINRSLSDVTFLIPIITPSFFESPACRSEFKMFSLKEKMLGVNRLILPLYYVDCEQLGGEYEVGSDDVADIIRSRNWTDWRQYRFKPLTDEAVASALAGVANMVKLSIKEINSIGRAAENSAKHDSEVESHSVVGLPKITPEEEIANSDNYIFGNTIDTNPHELFYEIAEVHPLIAHDETARKAAIAKPYHVYTRQFDEVVEAAELAERAELLKLHKYIGRFSKALNKIHDSSLTSLLSRFSPKDKAPGIAVSILIDNSGSMRGERITHTAAWCMLILEWMDRLRIPIEILGFTTRAWKGGQSREKWLASGKPASPGRLNDLRHVIYKSFSASVGVSAPNLGLMAREGLLKENVDGEALLWAASRLQSQPSTNKILFVISDGAPVDDSTLSVNSANFLEKHLISVIDSLSAEIKLYAIGVGYDVSRYYPNSVALNDASELGPRLFETLVNDPAFSSTFSSLRPRKRYRFSATDKDSDNPEQT